MLRPRALQRSGSGGSHCGGISTCLSIGRDEDRRHGNSAIRVGMDGAGEALLAGRGKGKESESDRHAICCGGRTEVDEARTRVDPGGLADNDIHRLVRVTAF